MTSSEPIVLYDIASRTPLTPYAPNPWKARYALNMKGIHYRTEWVELTQVPTVRKNLGAASVRYHWDGSPFYTLPVITDPSTNKVIGDTFLIAQHIDQKNPSDSSESPNGGVSLSLFPPLTKGLLAAFNAQVDTFFNPFVILFCHGIPFNPETAEESKAEFIWRARAKTWDDLTLRGEERAKKLVEFEVALGEFSKFFLYRSEGPFLEGKTPTYADCIIGGWLAFMNVTLKEWDQVQTWHDGLLG